MSPQQQAYMTQTLADQTRMQQGQINKNREIANIASSPDTSMMENQAAADMAMGNRAGYPNQIIDRTAEILAAAEANGGMIDGTEVVNGDEGINLFRESFLRNRSLDREPQTIYGGLDGTPIDSSMLLSEGPQTRQSNKPDAPFVPEGQEGVDYYQDVTGDYFAMEDDLGTNPLVPIPDMMSSGPDGRSARGDSSRPLTEAELAPDTGELTSGDMGALSDSFAAIDAKYAGSTTEVSGKAELNDVIGVIANEFLGMTIEETALTPDAPAAEPSYRFADEGQNTGESTSNLMAGGGTPFDNPYVPPPLEDVVNPSNVAEIMFGIDTAMPQNGVRSADNTMTMPTFREDVLPAPVYTPVPQPVAQPQPVYNTPPSAPPSVLSRPTPTPVARPPASAYTWRPSYGGSGGYRF
jgi:hypothetical protein